MLAAEVKRTSTANPLISISKAHISDKMIFREIVVVVIVKKKIITVN